MNLASAFALQLNRWLFDAPGFLWALLGGSGLAIVSFLLFAGSSDGRVFDLGGLSIMTAWTFFTKRHDFMLSNLKRAGGLPFRFRILQYKVVAVSGGDARKRFFNTPSLDFQEGYRMLVGGPKMEDIDIKSDVLDSISDFVKRLNLLLRKERIADTLPIFLEDINRRMLDWGKEGCLNPFKEVYDITVRMATCHELSQDIEAIRKLDKIYWDIEKSATPISLLLPWLPSPSKRLREKAMMELYLLFLKYVQNRRAAGAEANDPIDALIQNGDADNDIVELIIGVVFTGFVNTGVNSCWAILYLGTHPEWRQRVTSELNSVISKYTQTLPTGEPFYKLLSSVPLAAWEAELPVLDLIIRETIRLSLNVTAPRRNRGEDIIVQNTIVKTGEFLVYNFADTHLNPEIYSNPEEFDPGRFGKGREEDKNAYMGYLGWGAGRHPCAGMRIAKLEIKLVLAMLLLGYDYTLVDEHGQLTNILPKPNRNDIQQSRPLGKTVFLKFRRIRD